MIANRKSVGIQANKWLTTVNIRDVWKPMEIIVMLKAREINMRYYENRLGLRDGSRHKGRHNRRKSWSDAAAICLSAVLLVQHDVLPKVMDKCISSNYTFPSFMAAGKDTGGETYNRVSQNVNFSIQLWSWDTSLCQGHSQCINLHHRSQCVHSRTMIPVILFFTPPTG